MNEKIDNQKKQVENIFYQREQEFRILVEEAPDIIARFDNEYRCVYINSAVEKEFGISPREFFWKTFKEVGFPPKIVKLWEEALDDVFGNGKEKIIYAEQETIKGLRYYYSRLLPEYDKDGKVKTVFSITRDITEVKEIDRIKSEFITVTSHQLRTPLSIVRWCSRSLLDRSSGKINEEQEDYLNKIYLAVKEMIKLTNAFLNVAVLDLGALNISSDSVDIVEISEETLSEFEEKLKNKNLEVIKKYDIKTSRLKADYRLLKIILRGLISNAVKYSYRGGEITLKVETKGKDVLFKIGDNGCGIPENQKSKIFTKFFRAENVKSAGEYGIGLDLYIIKSIMKNCEGEIWFQSPNPELLEKGKKTGEGTMFYFSLPLKGISKKKGKSGLTI